MIRQPPILFRFEIRDPACVAVVDGASQREIGKDAVVIRPPDRPRIDVARAAGEVAHAAELQARNKGVRPTLCVQEFGENHLAIEVRITFLGTPGRAEQTRAKLISGKNGCGLGEIGKRLTREIGSPGGAIKSSEEPRREKQGNVEEREPNLRRFWFAVPCFRKNHGRCRAKRAQSTSRAFPMFVPPRHMRTLSL